MDVTRAGIEKMVDGLVVTASKEHNRGTAEGRILLECAHVIEQLGIKANLGYATTGELLDELRARIEVDYFVGGGGLGYTTMEGRPEAIALDPE